MSTSRLRRGVVPIVDRADRSVGPHRIAAVALAICATLTCMTLPASSRAAGAAQALQRRPAVTMSHRGADWLERAERVREEQPDRVLDVMDLRSGDVVADIGCATGYFARRIAPRISPGGTVYCVDIQPEMLERMAAIAAREGVTGIEPVLGTPDDPRLAPGSVDWIVLADVYHEMSAPEAMLRRMRESLAPGGRVALLEYRLEDATGDHIKSDHRMSARQVMAEWSAAGFELEALHEFLPAQHLFVLRVAASNAASTTAAATPTPAIGGHDPLAASDDGLVDARAVGHEPGAVTIRARRRVDDPVLLTTPVGMAFAAQDGAATLLARRDGALLLRDDDWHETTIRTLTLSPTAPAPEPGTPLDMRPPDVGSTLVSLMYALQAGTYIRPGRDRPLFYPPQTLDVERTAAWIAGQDPRFEEIESLVGDDRMPAAYVAAFALVFCEMAGIDIESTAMWADRGRIFDGLRYPPLVVWYEER